MNNMKKKKPKRKKRNNQQVEQMRTETMYNKLIKKDKEIKKIKVIN